LAKVLSIHSLHQIRFFDNTRSLRGFPSFIVSFFLAQTTKENSIAIMVLLFNETKRATLAVVPKISGFLSLCGSSWIIVEVSTDRGKRQTVYNRLLLCLSVMDAAVSITYIASTWPIPRFSPTVVGASGTVQTCTAQGFFNQ
jgi:hypothetical protein